MRLPENHFEWITLWLAMATAVAGLLLVFIVTSKPSQAHMTIYRNANGDPNILDFQSWENPVNKMGCCGENDCRPIDMRSLQWKGDAVSFIHDKTGKPERYWIPRAEIDGSPNQITYGCVVGVGDPVYNDAFPGQKKARCLMLSGAT